MLSLEGKVAIVTGASRGMGRRFARSLAEAGASVALLARPSEKLTAAEAECGDRARAFPCDVADPVAVNAAVSAAAAHFGRIDILINNAAIFDLFRVETASDAQVQRHIDVNLLGPIWCTRAAIPHMRAAGGGDIVNVSSESVRMPFPFLTVYAATKGALETLSAGLRSELRDDGIRVTVLRAGKVAETEGTREWNPKIAAEFFDTVARSGHAALGVEHAPPEAMARALISHLELPRNVNVDLIEVRAF